MDNYTLAVIIPCWNCESYIGEMLDGLLNQSFTDWKAFLVDDGCTDGSYSIINEYSSRDERIHYYLRDREPKGAQTCRNIGFDLSVGAEYVIFFDADDLIAPYCFKQRVQFMETRNNLDFGVFLGKSFVNDPKEVDRSLLFGFRFDDGVDDIQRLLRRTHPFVVWNNIYRRSALLRVRLTWDESLLSIQDSDFNLQAIVSGLTYDYCEDGQIDYYYRTWHSSECTSRKIFTDAHKKSHLYFINKLYHSLSQEQINKYRVDIDDYLFYFIEMFIDDRLFINKLLHLNWLRRRSWFCLKVRAYCFLKRHNRNGKRWLFPTLYNYRKEYDKKYREYRTELLNRLIEPVES